MDAVSELVALIKDQKGIRTAALVWAECIAVDWENGVMDARGVTDDLEYYDVQLGMPGMMIKPKIGSMCLLGILEGESAAAFLIRAEDLELIEIRSANIIINDGDNGGLIRIEDLVKKLNVLEKDINSLKQVYSGWTPVPQDGGGALKTSLASWSSQKLTETTTADLENDKVKH